MFRITFCLLFVISAILNVESKSELSILHAPKGLLFRENHELLVSKLRDIFATTLGYTVEEGYDWRGFEIKNPFTGTAQCLLVFHLPGVNGLNIPSKTTLPLLMDASIDEIFSDISRIIEMRYPNTENTLQRVDLGGNLGMNKNVSTDIGLDELTSLKGVVNRIVKKKNKNGAPDIYWITLTSIAEELQQRDELKELLALTLNALSEKVQKMYNGKAFVAAITEDREPSKIRSKRETTGQLKISPTIDLNLAEDYSEDFPVIFNIILWLSLTLLFSLFAISMVIGGMDPGRDSIIYRMTSTRMKKDN